MLSKSERKYFEYPVLSTKEYKYVLKHRITQKMNELQIDLDLILHSNTFFKDWLKLMFEDYLIRVDWD